MIDFALTVQNDLPISRAAETVTVGVPFAKGVLKDASALRVSDKNQQALPAQARAQNVWGDGSVRWALIHFLGDLDAAGPSVFRVREEAASANGNGQKPANFPPPLKIQRDPARIRVDTGKLQFSIDGGNFRGLEHVRIPSRDGKSWVNAAVNAPGGSLYLIDAEGRTHTAPNGTVTLFEVEEAGPLVCTIHVEGELAAEPDTQSGHGIVEYDFWIRAFAGSQTARCFLTLRNPRAATRRVLGHWPLGLQGSICFQEIGFQVQPKSEGIPYVTLHGGELDYQALEDSGPVAGITAVPAPELAGNSGDGTSEIYRGPFTEEAKVIQDSSGGKRWFNRNHIDRDWKLTVNYKGWKSFVDGKEGPSGDRADAWIACEDPRMGMAMGMRHFWQNFPKGVRAIKQADGSPLVQLCFWPREVALANGFKLGQGLKGAHELQGGEQKTHEFVLQFFRGDRRASGGGIGYSGWPETAISMVRATRPVYALAEYKQYAESGAFDYVSEYDKQRAPEYEAVNEGSLLAKPANLFSQIEAFDEYGWRNFGDVIADGEIAGRVLSHYNLEYDMGWAMLLQAVRTQRPRADLSKLWWQLGEAALRHESDLDVYHTNRDKHNKGAYNHGKHHHTDHAYEAGRSTHRAYEEDGMQGDYDVHDIRGGGPESQHMNSRGMFTYAMMSGYPAAIKVTKLMGDLVVWKIKNDIFAQIKNFSRDSGHNLQILLSAYQLTGDNKYLDTARYTIDVTHPEHHPWREGFPVRLTPKPGYREKTLTMWTGAIFIRETARVALACEAEGIDASRAISCLLAAAEIYNQYGWDDQLGRFAHWISPEGKQGRNANPWNDYRMIDAVTWACIWQKDAAKRNLWMSRCRRDFEVAGKILASDAGRLPYHSSKCSTVSAGYGGIFLELEKQIKWTRVSTASSPQAAGAAAASPLVS